MNNRLLITRILLRYYLYSVQMKRLHFILLTVTLLLSQWGSIDHVYHAHKSGEVCDYCISVQPLDHAVNHVTHSIVVVKESTVQQELLHASIAQRFTRHYAVRAPPRLI